MGDLNDWDSSFTDASGNTGTSKTLSILKENPGLTNVNSRLPLANRSSSGVGKSCLFGRGCVVVV